MDDVACALSGRVAVVTGASRGIGKGIALALAEQGAIVYVTGRTVGEGDHTLPGTIGATAAECTRRGGQGIAVRVDHGRDDEVAALFDRVAAEQGCLDILVNNAFSLPEDLTDPQPFWEKPLTSVYTHTWSMGDMVLWDNTGLMHRACEFDRSEPRRMARSTVLGSEPIA